MFGLAGYDGRSAGRRENDAVITATIVDKCVVSINIQQLTFLVRSIPGGIDIYKELLVDLCCAILSCDVSLIVSLYGYITYRLFFFFIVLCNEIVKVCLIRTCQHVETAYFHRRIGCPMYFVFDGQCLGVRFCPCCLTVCHIEARWAAISHGHASRLQHIGFPQNHFGYSTIQRDVYLIAIADFNRLACIKSLGIGICLSAFQVFHTCQVRCVIVRTAIVCPKKTLVCTRRQHDGKAVVCKSCFLLYFCRTSLIIDSNHITQAIRGSSCLGLLVGCECESHLLYCVVSLVGKQLLVLTARCQHRCDAQHQKDFFNHFLKLF